MVEVTSQFILPESALGFSFAVRTQTEMKILCDACACMLTVVSSKKNNGINGIIISST